MIFLRLELCEKSLLQQHRREKEKFYVKEKQKNLVADCESFVASDWGYCRLLNYLPTMMQKKMFPTSVYNHVRAAEAFAKKICMKTWSQPPHEFSTAAVIYIHFVRINSDVGIEHFVYNSFEIRKEKGGKEVNILWNILGMTISFMTQFVVTGKILELQGKSEWVTRATYIESVPRSAADWHIHANFSFLLKCFEFLDFSSSENCWKIFKLTFHAKL